MGYLERVVKDIKSLKIQGAENVARAAVDAWYSAKDKKAASKILISTRPVEPMLRNVIKYLNLFGDTETIKSYIDTTLDKIAKYGSRLVKDDSIIYTHCHSSTVERVLEYAHNEGKKFTVNITETRPNYQGRLTAKNLARKGIEVNLFVDSAALSALKNANAMFIGADAITSYGEVINKIGSGLFAKTAADLEIPVYVAAHSLKIDPKTSYGRLEKIENRSYREVWKEKPKNIKVINPVFEVIQKEHISAMISEFGLISPDVLVEKVRNTYQWMW